MLISSVSCVLYVGFAMLVRYYLSCICLLLASITECMAAVDICQDPSTYSHLSIGFDNHSKSTIERNLGETDQENVYFDLTINSAVDEPMFSAGHRYTVFNVAGLEPETNGHLHTTFVAFHRLSQTDQRSLRFSIAPAFSASSNVARHREFSADALQLLAAVVWGRRLSERVRLRYGICGDHRFGRYRIYPLLSMHWKPHPDWTVEVGFPIVQLVYRVSAQFTSNIRIRPDGNEWYVLDKTLTNHSQFVYEAYALEWTFDWQAQENFVVSASIGRQMHNRYEMTLLDGSRVHLSSDAATRIGAALEWRF